MKTIQNELFDWYLFDLEDQIPEEWYQSTHNRYFLQGFEAYKFINDGSFATLEILDPKDKALDLFKKAVPPKFEKNMVQILQAPIKDVKIEPEDFAYIMRYFQWGYETYKAEFCVMMMLHQENKEWVMLPVLQYEAGHGSVKYIMPSISPNEETTDSVLKAVQNNEQAKAAQTRIYNEYVDLVQNGYKLYGTIHSHCDFSAFHSGVDDADEKKFDGLHITIGHVKKDQAWSYSARYMVRTCPIKVEMEKLFNVDMKLIESMVDSIELEEEDKQLMFPNLVRETLKATKIPYGSGQYDWSKYNKGYHGYSKNQVGLWGDDYYTNRDNYYNHAGKASSKAKPNIDLDWEKEKFKGWFLDPIDEYKLLLDLSDNQFYLIDKKKYDQFYDDLDGFVEYDLEELVEDLADELEEDNIEETEEEEELQEEVDQIFAFLSNEYLNDDHKPGDDVEVRLVNAS